jgi:pyrophosphatase PpaX
MPRYATVLFDLDGTLLDSIGLIVESFEHTLRAHGLPPEEPASFVRGIGTPLADTLRPFVREGLPLEALVATYRAYNIEHHDARVGPFEGAVATVRALLAEGVRVAIVTSKNRQGTERGLRRMGLAGEVTALVCLEDVTRAKPDREPVDRAIALVGGDPRTTLFVGDSPHDMLSGRAAGVATAVATWGPFSRDELARTEPTHWLAKVEDVLALTFG